MDEPHTWSAPARSPVDDCKARVHAAMTAYGRREDDCIAVPLMRLRDVAMVLAVSPDFIERHCKSGQIPHVRMGRRIMIPRAVVDQLARDGVPSLPRDD